jgi:hypothetical protein
MAHTLMRSDADVVRHNPLGAQKQGIATVDAWAADRRQAAREVLRSPLDPAAFRGARGKLRTARRQLGRLLDRRGLVRWNENW